MGKYGSGSLRDQLVALKGNRTSEGKSENGTAQTPANTSKKKPTSAGSAKKLPPKAPTQSRVLAPPKVTPPPKIQKPTVDFGSAGITIDSPEDDFKLPVKWVEHGIKTAIQPDDKTKGRPLLSVTVGLDFGTALTKAAVEINKERFIVDWSGTYKSKDLFYLAGEFSTSKAEDAFIGRMLGAKTFGDLKKAFLERDGLADAESMANAATYMSLVFRYIRAWIYHNLKEKLADRPLRWILRIGLPTDRWDRGSSLSKTYTKIGKLAWEHSGRLKIKRADVLQDLTTDVQHTSSVELLEFIPEFAAQIAGYLNSPYRQEHEMHLLVDVGAGTVDVACFQCVPDKQNWTNRLVVFSTGVFKLGTYFLLLNRIGPENAKKISKLASEPIPDAAAFAKRMGVNEQAVEEKDTALGQDLANKIGQIIIASKKLNPKHAAFFGSVDRPTEKKAPLVVILTGGGAAVATYQQAVRKAISQCNLAEPRFIDLPKDNSLKELPNKSIGNFGRVSVAAGLTYQFDNIEIFKPKHIPAIETRTTRAAKPDREELYGK